MRLISKSAIITSSGAALLGASLVLSSAGVVSGSSPPAAAPQIQRDHGGKSCSSSSYCLTESNSGTGGAIHATTKGASAIAVYGSGSGSSSVGIKGNSNGKSGIGLYGLDTKSGGTGVYGDGGEYGVFGKSAQYGVVGQSTETGVYGTGNSAFYGYGSTYGTVSYSTGTGSSGGYAVYADALSSGGTGAYAYGGAYGVSASSPTYGIFASGGQAGGIFTSPYFPIEAGGASGEFFTDSAGDGQFDGEVTALGGFATVVRSRGGALVSASETLAPSATIEDTGTARLIAGQGVVHLERDFASTIDISKGYQVFLTPDGDTRGLYVASKYENGFIVREAEHGRSSVDFDYRVVAHPAGVSDRRFPTYNPKRPPHPKPAAPALPKPPTLPPSLAQPTSFLNGG